MLDWEKIATTPGVISNDRVHLTANGRAVLATAVARALEFAPDRNNGTCLDSRFTDDSEVLDDDEIIPVETTVPTEAVVDTTVAAPEPESTTSVP